jgi:Ni/Fe-hydrogenase 1 B-type cytochrome subunit
MSTTADTAAKPVVVPGVEDLHGTEPIRKGAMSVYVYQTPIRLWHWATALSIVVLCVTGFLIGRPLPSTPGEASDQFLLGYIRAAHFIAGYVLAIGIVARTYWALVGNVHAKQIYTVPIFTKGFWGDVVFQIRWYLFLEKVPRKHVGHNPLARLTMFALFLNCVAFQIITGFALYGEGAGIDSWQFQAFGWAISLFGGSMQVHTAHHVGMWVMILFVMTHVYAAIREDIMGRASILSTMISGWRNFRDTRD